MTKAVFLGGVVKTVLMGGAGGAVYLSNILDVPDDLAAKNHTLDVKSLPTTISSLNDIELYERYYGCRFVFIESWPEKTWNFRKFLKQHENNHNHQWKELIIKGANDLKQGCTQKQIVTLAFNSGNKSFGHHHPN